MSASDNSSAAYDTPMEDSSPATRDCSRSSKDITAVFEGWFGNSSKDQTQFSAVFAP